MNFKIVWLGFAACLVNDVQAASYFDVENFAMVSWRRDDLHAQGQCEKYYQDCLESEIKDEIPHYTKAYRIERRASLVKKAEELQSQLCSWGKEKVLQSMVYGSFAACIGGYITSLVYARYANKDSKESHILNAILKFYQDISYFASLYLKELISDADRSYWKNFGKACGLLAVSAGSLYANSLVSEKLTLVYGKRRSLYVTEKAIAAIDTLDKADTINVTL